jgi:hypothetical protein
MAKRWIFRGVIEVKAETDNNAREKIRMMFQRLGNDIAADYDIDITVKDWSNPVERD